MSLFVEAREEYLKFLIRRWALTHWVVTGPKAITVSYDKLEGDTETLVKELIKGLGLTPTDEQKRAAIENGSFIKMQENYTEGHLREGVINNWSKYLDEKSVERIDHFVAEITRNKTYNEI